VGKGKRCWHGHIKLGTILGLAPTLAHVTVAKRTNPLVLSFPQTPATRQFPLHFYGWHAEKDLETGLSKLRISPYGDLLVHKLPQMAKSDRHLWMFDIPRWCHAKATEDPDLIKAGSHRPE
jgi:hypothetical protein